MDISLILKRSRVIPELVVRDLSVVWIYTAMAVIHNPMMDAFAFFKRGRGVENVLDYGFSGQEYGQAVEEYEGVENKQCPEGVEIAVGIQHRREQLGFEVNVSDHHE